ncbi:hypothetical protein SAMN04488691_10669 [Haloferax larsenii]|uniref:Uncharacterized protein n=1 Tax=Haloferax larsenii TaxID=302484 RepID=A0A1H7RKQ7_HALLR|nr:hypothetical protein SAMN04488691_10669 [Haloferax larsenii]
MCPLWPRFPVLYYKCVHTLGGKTVSLMHEQVEGTRLTFRSGGPFEGERDVPLFGLLFVA